MRSPTSPVPLVPALLLAAGAMPLVAQVRLVPSQYATIGAALASAVAGDTILVAAGVYYERLVWPAVDGIRLLGERGAANTVIDGGAGGTVVRFQGGVTRATVLAGFTIRNGFLSATLNTGAGVQVQNCSPTIRDNRITGNAIDSPNYNWGGGLYVTGTLANPLVLHNEIDNNEVRNGGSHFGAGIHVATGSGAEIVANDIHDNRSTTASSASVGFSDGAGIHCAGTALIASNRIVGNVCGTPGFNLGGGIAVATSTGVASVFNNTIAGNVTSGGVFNFGAGVYVEGSATATLRGNVIAYNYGTGIHRSSQTGGSVDSDADDVWNNLGDYVNVNAGSNSISVDPLFVSATDVHLTAGSPCIDAIGAAHLPSSVSTDFDRDPRRIDGDGDGGATDGARLDIGADEWSAASTATSGVPQIGNAVAWTVASAQPSLFAFGVGFDVGNLVLEPWGSLLLGPTSQVVAGGATPGSFSLAIPNASSLRGITIVGQGLVLWLASPGGQFTNLASLTVF